MKPADVKAAEVKPKGETPDLQAIKNAVSYLNPGDVSDFIPVEKGGLLAVLEKRAGLNLLGEDVFINVAGGMTVDEPAADQAVVGAVASSLPRRPARTVELVASR